jgi:hypothetical protein
MNLSGKSSQAWLAIIGAGRLLQNVRHAKIKNMQLEQSTSSGPKTFIRIFAFILGVPFLGFGILLISSLFFQATPDFDNYWLTLGILLILAGVALLKFSFFQKNKKTKETLIGGQNFRFALFLELLGYITSISIILFVFKYNSWESPWWWLAFNLMLGVLARFFLFSSGLLRKLGMNPWLSATLIVPLFLMLKLVIYPNGKI